MIQSPDVTLEGVWDGPGVGVLPIESFCMPPVRRMTFYPYGERWFLPRIVGEIELSDSGGISEDGKSWTLTIRSPRPMEVISDPRYRARFLRWLWFHPTGFRWLCRALDRRRLRVVDDLEDLPDASTSN